MFHVFGINARSLALRDIAPWTFELSEQEQTRPDAKVSAVMDITPTHSDFMSPKDLIGLCAFQSLHKMQPPNKSVLSKLSVRICTLDVGPDM